MRKIAFAIICDCCGVVIRKDTLTARPGEWVPVLDTNPRPWDLCLLCAGDVEAAMSKIRTKRIPSLRRKSDSAEPAAEPTPA